MPTNVIALLEQSRAGRRDSGWIQLPQVVAGKLQVAITVDALERVLNSKELSALVQFSTDGVALDRPAFAMTWKGHSKLARPGLPTGGPAMRIDNLLNGQPWLGGLFVRVQLDMQGAVRCSTSVDILDGT